MVIRKEKYTLCHFDNKNRIFGFIHKDVKKKERLALQAVLKEQNVFDITDIWNLNFEKLKKAKDSCDNEKETYTVEFNDFDLFLHNYTDSNYPVGEMICYISKKNVSWIIGTVDISKCEDIAFFITETVNGSKLFDKPIFFNSIPEEMKYELVYDSGRIILQKKNFTVIKLGAHTDYVFSFGELVLVNENGLITELDHNVSTSTLRHINEYKRMVDVL